MTIGKNKVTVTLNIDPTDNLYTGDLITGVITLDIKRDLQVESISMEVIGISKTQWSRFTPTIPYLKIFSEKQKVLYIKQDNLFFEDLQTDKMLKPGMYYHPFHFALPYDLPSTFHSSIASVKYYINIKSKPSSCRVKKVKPFKVLANINLNESEDMLKPFTKEFQQNVCTKANVMVTLKTYKCFAPRQIIPFEVSLTNEKTIKIKKVEVKLVQKLRYTVSSGYAADERNIHTAQFNGLKSTALEVFRFTMEIPQIAPSSINVAEPMIHISYELRVEVFFAYHFNLIESIPVTVTAVPVIHNVFDNEK